MKENTALRAWLLCAILAAPGLAATPDGGLFVPKPGKAVDRSGNIGEMGVIRSRPVDVDFRRLANAADTAKAGSGLRLNLFSDVALTAVLDRIVFETEETFSWVGHLQGVPGSHVTLVAGGGVLAGGITFDGAAYRVRHTRQGFHAVEQVDTGAFPPEVPPIPVFAKDARAVVPRPRPADDGSTFDLMVLYTPAARVAVGGKSAIQSLVTLGVTETNLAYENSGVIPRLRLVHMAEIKYQESGDAGLDLRRLRDPRDRQMDKVLAWRNARRADLVMLVGHGIGGPCGIGYLMAGSGSAWFESSAYSFVDWQCISPNYTFGHELGHNLGSNHAPDDPGIGTGAFPFSFGYKDPTLRFRDIMSYPCIITCPRILHFSSPLVTSDGLVTGTATQDNARSFNEVRTVVANFRVSRRR